MAKNLRVHELAKELGMTNAETVELCHSLGVPIKGQSSSLNEAYADMVRRKAEREGLTRDEQPQEAVSESGGSKSKKTGSNIRIHALAKELEMTMRAPGSARLEIDQIWARGFDASDAHAGGCAPLPLRTGACA